MSQCYCPCDVYAGMSSSPAHLAEPNLLIQTFDPDVILAGPAGVILPVDKKKGQGNLYNISFHVPLLIYALYSDGRTRKPHHRHYHYDAVAYSTALFTAINFRAWF